MCGGAELSGCSVTTSDMEHHGTPGAHGQKMHLGALSLSPDGDPCNSRDSAWISECPGHSRSHLQTGHSRSHLRTDHSRSGQQETRPVAEISSEPPSVQRTGSPYCGSGKYCQGSTSGRCATYREQSQLFRFGGSPHLNTSKKHEPPWSLARPGH